MAVTATENTTQSVKRVYFAWTSDSSGDATGTTTNTFDGDLIGFATDPDGTAAPTDDYDVTLTDANGFDLLMGNGANRDTADIEYVAGTSLGAVSGSKLTLTVANAGDTKKGVAVVWIR